MASSKSQKKGKTTYDRAKPAAMDTPMKEMGNHHAYPINSKATKTKMGGSR